MGKTVKLTASSSYIPHEIMFFNILNRLPAETLLRFSSVSKLWYKTIRDPEFVHSLMIQERENSKTYIVALFKVKNEDPMQRAYDYLFVYKGLEYFRIHTKKWTRRVGDCNGLYCLRSKSGFEICNPSTQEFLYHPFPPSPPLRCLKSCGFGFDPLKNNYKVVQVVHGDFARCMVYTLGNNSWKDITVQSNLTNCLGHRSFTELDGSSCAGMVNPDSGLYLNGALYWYFRGANMVLRFDLHYEIFSLIRVCPFHSFDSFHSKPCFLTEWLGCLALAFQTPRRDSIYIYRYTLSEHNLPDFRPQHEGETPAIRVWQKFIVTLPRVPFSKVRVLGGESTLLYWYTEADGGSLSFYRPENCHYWRSETGCETGEKFPLPAGVKYSSVCEYRFSHHIENPLSLKDFVPKTNHWSLIKCTEGETVVQVKSVSSL